MLAACENPKQDKLTAEGARIDSVALVRQQLLDEVTASAGFLDSITEQLEKAHALTIAVAEPGDLRRTESDRQEALAGVGRLVAKLDSVQVRLISARNQIKWANKKEAALVAVYEKNVAEMQAAAETQRSELQAVVDQQHGQIVSLTGQVDTLDKTRVALTDSVGHLTAQKNTAYFVIGTREELIKKGILVAEGQKRFLVAGSRNVVPARKLDPASFTKIDRLSDRMIILPTGEYQILSRQNPEFATVTSKKKSGRIAGVVTIEQPEQFWESSPFLIIVKS
jgi:hypothetical protein